MSDKIQDAILNLHEVLKQELGDNVVSASIYISHHEYKFTTDSRSPSQLKSHGISMRNIKGEWIK